MAACSCLPSFSWTSSSSSSSSRSVPRTSTGSSSSNLVPVTKTTFLSFRIHRPQPINNNQVHYLQQQQHLPLSSHYFFSSRLFKCSQFHFSSPQNHTNDVDINNGSGNNGSGGGGGGGGGDGWSEWWSNDDDEFSFNSFASFLLFLMSRIRCDDEIFSNRKGLVLILSVLLGFIFHHLSSSLYPALARTEDSEIRTEEEESVWEVRGGKWIKFVPDYVKDAFVVKPSGSETLLASLSFGELWSKCKEICMRLMLPEGYPDSVTSDYLDYSLWRGVQGVASQISGVLATQALLYAVGLGKGVIPTAAAINWVLKDGIGYLSKILLSKYGRHFDVHPKGWRLFADLLENAAFGLEMITPVFPHLFVLIGATAGAGRSAAALIQAATRSCFYAGFAAQRNFAEVIAKGEAQGMVSKSIGIALGIALANYVGSSTSQSLVCFAVITWVHMYCNLKSYQAIQLRTFNPYRGSLVFSEYLLSGLVPPVKEVNDEEPLFPAVPFLNEKPESMVQSEVLSADAKVAAAEIDKRLQLGAKLSTVISNKEDALALFDLYKNEGYILVEHKDKYCVILKENCSQQDMLKSLFQTNYLYWLETNAGIKMNNIYDDCCPGGRLQVSLDYVQREFNHVKYDWELAGWAPDGLIARPLPNRIRT